MFTVREPACILDTFFVFGGLVYVCVCVCVRAREGGAFILIAKPYYFK